MMSQCELQCWESFAGYSEALKEGTVLKKNCQTSLNTAVD